MQIRLFYLLLVSIFLVPAVSGFLISHATAQSSDRTFFTPTPAPEGFSNIVPRTVELEGAEILGGEGTGDGRIVLIYIKQKDEICSGLRIAKNIILTAGHCLCDGNRELSSPPFVTNVDNPLSGGIGDWIEVTGRKYFPSFACMQNKLIGHDLALLYLAYNGALSNFYFKPPEDGDFQQLTLPGRNEELQENYTLFPYILDLVELSKRKPEKLWVAGYGINENGTNSVRREVELGVNSLSCAKRYARLTGCRPIKEFIIGAGLEDKDRDSCFGDSGGPVFIKGNNNKILPVGVVSRGLPRRGKYEDGACGAGGIYTHLGTPKVKKWLLKNSVPCTNIGACIFER